MSKAFIAGAGAHFPQASRCFDRFHVMKLYGNAIDAVRKEVVSESGSLPRGAMWVSRGNAANHSEKRLTLRQSICREHTKIGRAIAIRDYLADTWNYAGKQEADEHLKAVISWCFRCRMEPFVKLARSLKTHMEGILGYFKDYTISKRSKRSKRSTDYCSSHAAAHGDTEISPTSKQSHTGLRAALKSMDIRTQPTKCPGESKILRPSHESCITRWTRPFPHHFPIAGRELPAGLRFLDLK